MSWAEDQGLDGYDPEDMGMPTIDYVRGHWEDANGNDHLIKNMGHRHIQNCINALERTKEKWDFWPEDIKQINSKIREFKKELVRRTKFREKF